ncbi:hypothetical protein ASC89_11400 [Devosia sp. Root413D1]|uniref:hypothetical protein n=1 Tax=unclassified Devosia TaxID=196773 RepID=UPI000701CB23|nr:MULTISPECIES: hypothetical protein [unclassified Devosia]KQV08918.1 hypothetical protein ASC68_00930 [Devosia sp. Root105]KQW78914.1 hypothetical protein ASC89_11400 [Devosia sp. Root413D1]
MFSWLSQGSASIVASLLFIVVVFLIARVARLSQPRALALALAPPLAIVAALQYAFASGLI